MTAFASSFMSLTRKLHLWNFPWDSCIPATLLICFFFSSNTMYHGILHEIRISYFMVHCIKLSFLRIHLLLRCSVVSNSLRPHALEPARLLCPWDSSTKNPGVGHHFLLQGILETLGLNSNLLCCLHWQVDSLPLAPPEKPLRVHTCGQK